MHALLARTLVLAACLGAVAAQEKVVGERCNPGKAGKWGLYCEKKSHCAGAAATNSDRCVEGQTPASPRIVCCTQSGPAPADKPATPPTVVVTPPAVSTTTRKRFVWTSKPKPGPAPATTRPPPPSSTKRPQTTRKPPTTTAAQSATPARTIRLIPFRVAQKIAKKKCAEFAKYVNEDVEEHTLLIETKLVREPKCAMVGEELIAGGKPAIHGEFPHMVALGYQPGGEGVPIRWNCGGSLVSERYVLTAAHCTYHTTLQHVKWARLGSTQLNDPDGQTLAVAEIIRHPAYSALAHYDDIALLRLAKDPKLGPNLRPACVGMEPIPVVRRGMMDAGLYVTGWGLNETNGVPLDSLMKVDLYLSRFEICDELYAFLTGGRKLENGINRDSMICIGNNDTTKDSCQGDSGGPVQSKLTDIKYYCMYNVAGVTSFGVSACGGSLSASLYSNVRHYLPWIVAVVWPDEQA